MVESTPSGANVIAIANCKGGVAKTTTTVNLGAALASRGRRVLLIDLDAQQDLCAALRARIPRPGLADVLLSTAFFDTGNLADAFVTVHGMTVAGGYGIAHAERELATNGSWENALKRALAPHLPRFDYVLLDCAPSSNCLTTSALVAAHDVVVPIQTEFLAANQLSSIMSAVDDVRSRLNSSLKIRGFLPTMYSDGRKQSRAGRHGAHRAPSTHVGRPRIQAHPTSGHAWQKRAKRDGRFASTRKTHQLPKRTTGWPRRSTIGIK